jgi:hypothetical protein
MNLPTPINSSLRGTGSFPVAWHESKPTQSNSLGNFFATTEVFDSDDGSDQGLKHGQKTNYEEGLEKGR